MADFFETMKENLTKGVATVSTGSKNVIEKTKINSIIKSLEDEKKQLLILLGNKVFNFCSENEEGDIPRENIISFCEQIEKRNAQIEEQKAKIEELNAELSQIKGSFNTNISKVCSCGHENAHNANFCAKCGNKI